MKSLAHPDWPYTGTPNEWRGFAKKTDYPKIVPITIKGAPEYRIAYIGGYYQKINFGPELP